MISGSADQSFSQAGPLKIDQSRCSGRSATTKSQQLRLLAWALVIGAFGPYLLRPIGIRLEHIIIYPALITGLCANMLNITRIRIGRPEVAILGIFFVITLWTYAVTVLSGPSRLSSLTTIADLENYVQPLALVTVLVIASHRISHRDVVLTLHSTASLICALLFVNTWVSIATIFVDTWPLVKHFVAAEDVTRLPGMGTVWQRAVSMGRYSGIFNQPMEAGVAYSLGCLAWGYAASKDGQLSFFKLLILLSLIIGGILSVSKAFILGGIPVTIIYYAGNRTLRRIVNWRTLLSALPVVATAIYISLNWQGLDYFLRLFDGEVLSSRGLLRTYTAGRFGGDITSVRYLIGRTVESSPWYGFGFSAWDGNPRDNGYLEMFYQGGMVALLLYIAVLFIISGQAIKGFYKGQEEGRLLGAVLLMIIGTAMGAPVLTLNRSSILIWVVCVLCIRAIRTNPENYRIRKTR